MSRSLKYFGMALAAFVAIAPAARGQETSATPVLSGTYGTVVVGDIPGFLDRANALATAVVPDTKPGTFRNQFGGMLGDPTLSGLPAGSGLAVIIPQDGQPVAFVEVSADRIVEYQKLLKSRGIGSLDQADGLLIAATSNAALQAARAMAPQVKSQLLAGSGTPTLSGSVKLGDLLQKYDAQIQQNINTLAERAADGSESSATASQARSLEATMRVYYAMARQIDTLSLSIEPASDALTFNKMILPKQGVGAIAGQTSAQVGPSGADLLKLLPGKGAVRGEMNLNPRSVANFTQTVMTEIGQANDGETTADQAFAGWMKSFADTWTGAAAMAFIGSQEVPMSGAYALGVKDEAAALRALEGMPGLFEGTSLGRFYESLGLSFHVTFQKNVRQYQGVPIHRLNTDVRMTSAATGQTEQMQKMMQNLDYDVAIVNKTLLYAVAPYKIEQLIDAAKSGSNPDATPLVSQSKLPQGGWMYLDYSIGQVMDFARALSPDAGEAADMMKKMAEALKDTPPFQVAGYTSDRWLRFTARLSAETIRAFVQVARQGASQQAGSAGQSSSQDNDGQPAPSGRRSPGTGSSPGGLRDL